MASIFALIKLILIVCIIVFPILINVLLLGKFFYHEFHKDDTT